MICLDVMDENILIFLIRLWHYQLALNYLFYIMPTLLQINVTANWGSTGRIAEGIRECAVNNGWESWMA